MQLLTSNVLKALCSAGLLGLLSSGQAMGQSAEERVDVLFENVLIFDGKTEELSPASNVLVSDGVIETISEDEIAAEGAMVIDGDGRVLMPGLIDAHWHAMLIRSTPAQTTHGDIGYNNIAAADEAGDTLMRGFTTVRDVGGPSFGLKQAIDEGIVEGPRIYPSGAMITITGGHGISASSRNCRARSAGICRAWSRSGAAIWPIVPTRCACACANS